MNTKTPTEHAIALDLSLGPVGVRSVLREAGNSLDPETGKTIIQNSRIHLSEAVDRLEKQLRAASGKAFANRGDERALRIRDLADKLMLFQSDLIECGLCPNGDHDRL